MTKLTKTTITKTIIIITLSVRPGLTYLHRYCYIHCDTYHEVLNCINYLIILITLTRHAGPFSEGSGKLRSGHDKQEIGRATFIGKNEINKKKLIL